VAWEGWVERERCWEALAPSHSYQCVRVGLQLANRQGPASEEELLAFCQDLQSLSTTLVGEIEFPARAEAIRGAAELDRAIADLDIQIGLNVVKRNGPPFAVGVVAQAVAIAGGEIAADGRFHVTTSTGAECFSIANLEDARFDADDLAGQSTRGISLAMDVARAPDAAAAFEAFVDFARDLARVVEGELVDDNQRPVSPASLGAIGAEVARVRARLAALGVPAGSTLALRLFS
jgi:FtsZ-interacting cell division protein ZipA